MIGFLAKLFIKNNQDFTDNAVREKYGFLTGCIGILLNILLCVGKIIVGILSASISVVADGINNLSDAGSSVVTVVGFKIANKPGDKKHPFGHGRMEYVAAMIVSVIIVVVGVELFVSSLKKVIEPVETVVYGYTIALLCVAIAVKLYMFAYNYHWSKKIHSSAMKATAYDSISDAVSTTVVLICAIVTRLTSVSLDGYAGIAVAIFIVITGFRALVEMSGDILGKPLQKDFIKDVERFVLQCDGVHGVHDIIVHDYGPGRSMLSLHVEIPAEMDVLTAHNKIDLIERRLSEKFKCHTIIHMDPVVRSPEQKCLQEKIEQLIKEAYPTVTVHDFRLSEGESKIMSFDVVVPFEIKIAEEMITEDIKNAVLAFAPDYKIEIKVDRPLF